MSIKRMTAVWEHSQHKGTDLLLLLAIADNAADDGYAYPGIDYLARKIRMTERTVLRTIEKLEGSGELFVDHNRRYGNKYIVLTGMNLKEIRAVLQKRFSMLGKRLSDTLSLIKSKSLTDMDVTSEVTNCHMRSDIGVSSEVTQVSHEPSIEPSIEPSKDSFETSDDVSKSPPSPIDHPEQYTTAQIRSMRFTLQQWQRMLVSEQAGRNRKGVTGHIARKIKQLERRAAAEEAAAQEERLDQYLKPHREAMLDAVATVTGRSLDDPGVAGELMRYIDKKLWDGENPYTPDEVLAFWDWWQSNDWRGKKGEPVGLYALAGELSKWRNRDRRKGRGRSTRPAGRSSANGGGGKGSGDEAYYAYLQRVEDLAWLDMVVEGIKEGFTPEEEGYTLIREKGLWDLYEAEYSGESHE